MASKFRTLQKLRDVLRQDQVKAGHAGARASALERKAEERHIAHRQARFEADVVIASRDDFFVAQAEMFSVRGTEQWEWEWEAHKKAEQAGKDEKTAREKAEKAWQVAEEEDAMVETAKRMLKKAEKAHGDARRMVRGLRGEVACAEARVREVVVKVEAVRAGRGRGIGSLLVGMGVVKTSDEEEDEEDEVWANLVIRRRVFYFCDVVGRGCYRGVTCFYFNL